MTGFTGADGDRLAVRELLERYADAVFQRDAEAWASCWAEDGIWHFAGAVLSGREAMVATWKTAMSAFALADFLVQPGMIRIDGDTAMVRSYTREFFVLAGGGTRHISGQYDDACIRTAQGWRFAERRYRILHDSAA